MKIIKWIQKMHERREARIRIADLREELSILSDLELQDVCEHYGVGEERGLHILLLMKSGGNYE